MSDYFLSSEIKHSSQKDADFTVIPFPLEKSVSYGSGTKDGPQAIIEASSQLELDVEGYEELELLKIHTQKPIDCSPSSLTEIFEEGKQRILSSWENNSISVLLGGEHSVTNSAIQAISHCYKEGEVGILQFDAHMDLRDEYENSAYSHACVMKRAVDHNIPIFQVGVRNFTKEEILVRQAHSISSLDASRIHAMRSGSLSFTEVSLAEDFPSKLYISFDVDAFDSSVMPATGTPDPGGLFWWEAIQLLEHLSLKREIIGFDIVELAPIAHLHHCNYTAAKLTYFLMALAHARNNKGRDQ